MAAPPGWYPSSGAAHELRFWDGERWTDHRAAPGFAIFVAGTVLSVVVAAGSAAIAAATAIRWRRLQRSARRASSFL